MLEKTIEAKAVRAAKERGWRSYKFSSPAHRGVPDRLFLRDGRAVFIEFKRPGKKPTRLQARELELIRETGCKAEWTDSVERALEILGETRRKV